MTMKNRIILWPFAGNDTVGSARSFRPADSAPHKPVWSKQHGAYITLLSSWAIGTFLSDYRSWLQPVILIVLLSGFNGVEILADTLKRKTPQAKRKIFWMSIYAGISVVGATVLFYHSPPFRYLLPVLVPGGLAFVLLASRRLHKTIAAELLTFALFSAAGLLALNPETTPAADRFLILTVFLTAYFGLSVFLVKYRIQHITSIPVVLYILAAVAVVLYVAGISTPAVSVSLLIVMKTIFLLAASAWYRALPIKTIGYLEMGWQGLFIAIMVSTYS
jgi:hypothetical protein